MPVTEFQKGILSLLAQNRTTESYVAGSMPLLLNPDSTRWSHDIDIFNDSEAVTEEAFQKDSILLLRAGYSLNRLLHSVGFIRVQVERSGESIVMDWAYDSAFRFFPVMEDEELGFRLHPVDLSINKVLALIGRDEPRDVLDVLYVAEHYLSLGALAWAAAGKDPGVTPHFLLSQLERRAVFRPEELEDLLTQPVDFVDLKARWRHQISEAWGLIEWLSANEVGCLYIDRAGRAVAPEPSTHDQLARHYGRLGGVMPRMADDVRLTERDDFQKLRYPKRNA